MNSKYSDSCDKPGSHNYNGEQGTPGPAPAGCFALHPNRRYNTILKGETQHCTRVMWRVGGSASWGSREVGGTRLKTTSHLKYMQHFRDHKNHLCKSKVKIFSPFHLWSPPTTHHHKPSLDILYYSNLKYRWYHIIRSLSISVRNITGTRPCQRREATWENVQNVQQKKSEIEIVLGGGRVMMNYCQIHLGKSSIRELLHKTFPQTRSSCESVCLLAASPEPLE